MFNKNILSHINDLLSQLMVFVIIFDVVVGVFAVLRSLGISHFVCSDKSTIFYRLSQSLICERNRFGSILVASIINTVQIKITLRTLNRREEKKQLEND